MNPDVKIGPNEYLVLFKEHEKLKAELVDVKRVAFQAQNAAIDLAKQLKEKEQELDAAKKALAQVKLAIQAVCDKPPVCLITNESGDVIDLTLDKENLEPLQNLMLLKDIEPNTAPYEPSGSKAAAMQDQALQEVLEFLEILSGDFNSQMSSCGDPSTHSEGDCDNCHASSWYYATRELIQKLEALRATEGQAESGGVE